jgi:hypothetical protein
VTVTGRIIAALRPATLVAGGAFAVHELSYVAGYGGGASEALQNHSYLSALVPALAVLAALTLVATIECGLARPRVRRRSPLGRILTYAGAILVVFAVQETAESILAAGHPGAIGAVFTQGGPVAVPLALVFGALSWLAVRGLEAAEDRIAARFEPTAVPEAARSRPRPRLLDIVRSPAVLASGAAPRAPPSI